MLNITSEVYENKEYGLKLRYYVDMENIWWYCYDDISDYLDLEGNIMNKLFKHNVDENDKKFCNDMKDDTRLRFINSKAVRYLIKRSNDRNSKLIKVMNNIEFVGDAHDVYDDANELKSRIELLKNSMENNDYEEIVYQSYEIANSKSGRDILDKAGIIDKDTEELLDLMREDINDYDDYIDEFEITLITRREDGNDKFIQREYCRESSCPSWLINCVK